MSFRLGNFSRGGTAPFTGLLVGDTVVALANLVPPLRERGLSLRGVESLLTLLEHWADNFAALSKAPIENLPAFSIDELQAHAPYVPRQTFCTIANYRSHLVDTVRDAALTPALGEPDSAECLQRAAALIEERLRNPPYVCFKLPTTVIGPTDPLEIPRHAQRADWELELGVIIGRAGRRIARDEAMTYVAGYTLVNDVTVRELVARPDLPRLGSDWLQSKNAPGFLPMGPYVVPAAFVRDPYATRLTLRVNGAVMQNELASDMLFDIAAQIEYISQHAQLLPGDLICTGTPAGCGTRYKRFLRPGDVIEAMAPGFGTQRTTCVAEPGGRSGKLGANSSGV